jgi:hypothetical protein
MFFVAAGYDLNPTPRAVKDPQYFRFFESIGDVLPCRFCRDSYREFFDELDMTRYFGKPSGIVCFVHDIKNLVNEKLISQEMEKALEAYENLRVSEVQMTPEEIGLALRDISKIFYTKDPPELKDLIAELQSHRVQCSAKSQTCRKEAT